MLVLSHIKLLHLLKFIWVVYIESFIYSLNYNYGFLLAVLNYILKV